MGSRVRQDWATFTLLHFHLADLSLAGTVSVTPNPSTKHHVPCLGIPGGLNLPTLTGLFKVAPNPRHLAPLQSSPNQCWWPSKAAPTLMAQPNPTSAGTSALLKQLSLQGASPVYIPVCLQQSQRACSPLLWGQSHKSCTSSSHGWTSQPAGLGASPTQHWTYSSHSPNTTQEHMEPT